MRREKTTLTVFMSDKFIALSFLKLLLTWHLLGEGGGFTVAKCKQGIYGSNTA